MLEYCNIDVGRKVEELRSALERSQALLADLEGQQHNQHVSELAPGPSVGTTSGEAEAFDDVNRDAPEHQKDSAPEAVGGLTKLKLKLTQWFSSRTVAKASAAAAEPAARRLSFSRVNIEFPSQALPATDCPAPDGGSMSPQPAARLRVTASRQGRLQHAAGWSTKRAASFTATGALSFTNSGGGGAAVVATVLGPHARIPPQPQSRTDTDEGIPAPRPASFDVRPNNDNNILIPTPLRTSASPQQRRASITPLRDSVWSTIPDGRPAPWGTGLQASRSFRSHSGNDAVSGVETSGVSAPARAAGPWGVTEANLSPPLLPPLQVAAAAKSTPQSSVYVSWGGPGVAPERPPPQPLSPQPQPQPLPPPTQRPRSFTLGAYPTPLAGRGAAARAGSVDLTSGGVAAIRGSAGEDAGGDCRRFGAPHTRAFALSTERGTPGRLTMVVDGNLFEEEGQEEGGREVAVGYDERGSLLVSHVVGGWREPPGQKRSQPHHHESLAQPCPRQQQITTAALRLAGIPEAERPDRSGRAAAPRPGTRRSSDYSAARLIGAAAALGMGAGPTAAGAGVQAALAERSWGTRLQTWNNEVFVPVGAEGRR